MRAVLSSVGQLEETGLQERFERTEALAVHIEPDRTLQAEALALASHLNLVTGKAHHQLDRSPRWDFVTTVKRTAGWYGQVQEGQASGLACCLADLDAF